MQAEQKHLKRVRRKIKNKVSAQESRKRKKEYIDGLEHRVDKCTRVNQQLQNKVHVLESENKSLLSQLKKLQALVAQHYPTRLQAGAVVMVVALSFSLFFVPRLRPGCPPGASYHTVSGRQSPCLPIPHNDTLLPCCSALTIPPLHGDRRVWEHH